MSQYETPEQIASNLRQCPYNPSHLIEPSRLIFHVAKCRKAYNIKMGLCPFDSTHQMDDKDLDEHIKTCPARIAFDRHKYAVGEESAVVGAEVQEQNITFVGETWDLDAIPYDPGTNRTNTILSIPHGAKPAERRAFRQRQRRNFGYPNNRY